ncbi:phospho-N-acetylmuramoyl-pentapeptide-transferase [Nocardia sp. NPDC088792]|uniref:phospho-N-acetylmuramoyl-pentapeptide- transferase n=1 Tax=Nocardia sp. NPDC088792 TaxID=3364332 RepID=UPI00381C0425
MRQIMVAGIVGVAVAIILTPLLVKLFGERSPARDNRGAGPLGYAAERGTPTLGGVAVIAGMWAGYLVAHLVRSPGGSVGLSASGLLVLGLSTTCGAVGFADDFVKLREGRNSGVTGGGKFFGQVVAAGVFALLVLHFPDGNGFTPGSRKLSYVRDIPIMSLWVGAFVVLVCFLVVAWSSAVTISDGLDGLAAGSMAMTLGAYVLVTFWQYAHSCAIKPVPGCYDVRDPLDLALVCAAGAGACIGFLWWNAAPAKIVMGETGSLAMGGLLAGLSVTTRTELLMAVIGALFVAELASVVLQVAVFRTAHLRLFRMAPFHHHFEFSGWAETAIVIRFWLLAALSGAIGLMLFYAEHLPSRS